MAMWRKVSRSLAVSGAALALLASSCAPAALPAPAAPPPAPAAPARATPAPTPTVAPRYGGVVTMAVANDPASFELQQDTIPANIIANPAYNKVVQYDPTNGRDIVPDLAEKWEVSKDGLTYTFKVRQGVKFHNGAPLTAEDIAFNLQRVTSPPKGLSPVVGFLVGPATEKIETLDKDTVQVRLKYPLAALLASYALDNVPVYSKAWVQEKGDMKTTIMGTGPFKFKSYTPSVSAELEKNADYWVKGRPYLDGVTVHIIKDGGTRLAALRTGKVRMGARGTQALSPSEVQTLRKEVPNLQTYPIASPVNVAVFFNLRAAPVSDLRVRKAIHLAIDRQAAIKVVAEGEGTVNRFFPLEGWGIPEKELLARPGWRQPKDADIAEAKKLLAEAGFASGLSLTLLSRQNILTKNSAVFFTDQLAAVGIQAKVEILEDALFWERGRKAQHQIMVYTPATILADPAWYGRYYLPGGTINYSGNDADARLKEMWDKQFRILDVAQRKEALRQIEEYLWNENPPAIPVIAWTTFVVLWPEVRGFVAGVTDYATNNLQELWLAQ